MIVTAKGRRWQLELWYEGLQLELHQAAGTDADCRGMQQSVSFCCCYRPRLGEGDLPAPESLGPCWAPLQLRLRDPPGAGPLLVEMVTAMGDTAADNHWRPALKHFFQVIGFCGSRCRGPGKGYVLLLSNRQKALHFFKKRHCLKEPHNPSPSEVLEIFFMQMDN